MPEQSPVTPEQYAIAVSRLIGWAQGDTSAALPAATVLLSAYNGLDWQLDVTDLCHLDDENYQDAITVIRGRVETRLEPHTVVQNGDRIFRDLHEQWIRYHVANRSHPTCGT